MPLRQVGLLNLLSVSGLFYSKTSINKLLLNNYAYYDQQDFINRLQLPESISYYENDC